MDAKRLQEIRNAVEQFRYGPGRDTARTWLGEQVPDMLAEIDHLRELLAVSDGPSFGIARDVADGYRAHVASLEARLREVEAERDAALEELAGEEW